MYTENCISHALTMIGAERFIKTAAGVSLVPYRNEPDDPKPDMIKGEGQGKGDVGTLWASFSPHTPI